MSHSTHPYTIALAARLRQEEMLTQCDRYRLAVQATSAGGGQRWQGWPELMTAAAVVVALVLTIW